MKDPNRNLLKTRLAPGFWIDLSDNLHVSIEELLAVNHLADTPENRRDATLIAEAFIQQIQPDAQIIHRDTPAD